MQDFGPQLRHYVETRALEYSLISAERKDVLQQLSDYIQDCIDSDRPVRLTFICTHNSRRSIMAQLWAAVAAYRCGLTNVGSYSGGTEVTACNSRVVDALRRCGISVAAGEGGPNPRYQLHFADGVEALPAYSKLYDDKANPQREFCAVMTCSDADAACPAVPGASQRISLSYVDPKIADDSPEEGEVYDERCRQIARELLYAFSRLDTRATATGRYES